MKRRANFRVIENLSAVLRNERGSVLIFTAVALLALVAIAGITIDSAVMMTTRNQLQGAADAAALAGASGLLEGSASEAEDRAMAFAAHNVAVQDSGLAPVVISEADITFPEMDVIRVVTHRTAATNDPLRLFFRRVVDPVTGNQADVTAVAAARAFDICGSKCLKPWAIPDRWDDVDADGVYDSGEMYDADLTGYVAPVDVGLRATLKIGNPHGTPEPGIFYPINYPPLDSPDGAPLTGANWYREFIGDCSPFLVDVGDRLQLEPGNMVGPTNQGMDELVALDPGAYWDNGYQTVSGSAFAVSPRIALVPLFDPTLPPTSGRNWVTVTKIGAFFIEATGPGGEVTGRFVDATTAGVPCGTGVGNGLVKGLALIE